jgi:hypothetical protein
LQVKKLVFTKHAEEKLVRQKLRREWVEETARLPSWAEPDPFDAEVERRFKPIDKFGGRILRVAVVETPTAIRVISAFFDRDARRR